MAKQIEVILPKDEEYTLKNWFIVIKNMIAKHGTESTLFPEVIDGDMCLKLTEARKNTKKSKCRLTGVEDDSK